MTSRSNDGLHDSFRDWSTVSAHRNVELVRRFPRVPRRPDVRVSPADLNYDVPPDATCGSSRRRRESMSRLPGSASPEQRRLRCGFFPLVTRLHSGALLAVWREASSHSYCSFGRTVAARSPDGGRTWSAPWVVDFRRPGAWDAGGPENLVQTGDGTLWLGAWARIPEPESPAPWACSAPRCTCCARMTRGGAGNSFPGSATASSFSAHRCWSCPTASSCGSAAFRIPPTKESPCTPRCGARCSSCASPASRSPPAPIWWSWAGCVSSATAPGSSGAPTSVTSPRPPPPATW